MAKILGISCFYHDSAAALVLDGKIVAAAQQERFSRIKHDAAFPTDAVSYCLSEAGLCLEQLDAVIYYDKPLLKFERLLETYLAMAPKGLRSFLKAMPVWLKEKLYLKTLLRRELKPFLSAGGQLPKLLFSEHHQAHAASAFYPSPFEEAAVLCLDGVGEWVTSSIWHGRHNQLTPVAELHFPHSLGLLYSAFTYYCGFKVNSGEYKLMGLAPYGEPLYVELIYQHLLDVKADGSFALAMQYFDYETGLCMTTAKFDALFGGPARKSSEPIQQRHLDLARSVQQVTEELVLNIAKQAQTLTGSRNLCLAGGVALNCVANGRLLTEGPFEHIWIQPAAGDAGGALGAALLASYQYFDDRREVQPQDSMQGALLGPAFDDEQIQQFLELEKLPYHKLDTADVAATAARLLAEQAVLGWFQGRMEFGPRALGNRSILADARSPSMQKVMNLKIKNRESFRPFAPLVLAEKMTDYFQLNQPSPYMLLVAQLQPHLQWPVDTTLRGLDKQSQQRSALPAITHVDNSARVQSVDAQRNPLLHQLLTEFEQLTGTAVLVNTSFNVRGEPPVCTPADALRGFLATDMDYLMMGSFLLDKKEQDHARIALAKQTEFLED
jgi:carbamoyltransferase